MTKKIDCVVCGHMHAEGQPCDLCHCSGGQSVHPQGKPPIAERFKDVALTDEDEPEKDVDEKEGGE